MPLKISRCKGCGTAFEPWKLLCPTCKRALPICGAAVLVLAVILVFVAAYCILALLKWLTGRPPAL